MNNDSIVGQLNNYLPPLLFAPGSAWAYSNMGYDLLAVLVERVTRMPFAGYVQKNILGPSGMDRTFIPSTSNISAWLPKGLAAKDVVVRTCSPIPSRLQVVMHGLRRSVPSPRSLLCGFKQCVHHGR
ncbi:MAG: beta-lactamase family protein [Flavobacteriales bacterium]|nr:beta-lactamase family protein [Flavobacteriales bacterium]